ncbi:MAG: hypothetical protein KKD44_23090 [Proteobacteria bacterium]|nr:hypothetical protein [Pseudomonadota bacterium]
MTIYNTLKQYLDALISDLGFSDEPIHVRCQALSVEQAIGKPDRDDYPIVKGREVMVEATFRDARGQAFTDDFENRDFTLKELVNLEMDSNRNRACFVAGLNAVMRSLGLCDKTVHCKDQEPKICAGQLKDMIPPGSKVALIGYQPGFLAALAPFYSTRVIDLDRDNIGKTVSGVTIEAPDRTNQVIADSDMVLVTGSSLVNGTITDFLNLSTPVIFFGVTISGAARILNLKTYCQCGH